MPTDWRRFRCCMTKVLDQYYFKELPADEFQRQLKKTVVTIDNIHTMDELSDLMQEQQNIHLPENELQWKVWLVPNFNET